MNLQAFEVQEKFKVLKDRYYGNTLTLYDKKNVEKVKQLELIYYQLTREEESLTRELRAFQNSVTKDKMEEVVLRKKMIELDELKRRFKVNLDDCYNSGTSSAFESNLKAIKGYEQTKSNLKARGQYHGENALAMEEMLLQERKKLNPQLQDSTAMTDPNASRV